MQTTAAKWKGFGWALFWVALFFGVISYPLFRAVPAGKSIYLVAFVPAALWMLSIMLQHDRLNSRLIADIVLVAAILCCVAGVMLDRYEVFGGMMAVLFAGPLIFVAVFEISRLVYIWIRHETPCINYRSGRWLGDPPVNGFFTEYPPGKVISWGDALFGITQAMVPMVIFMTLLITAGVMRW